MPQRWRGCSIELEGRWLDRVSTCAIGRNSTGRSASRSSAVATAIAVHTALNAAAGQYACGQYRSHCFYLVHTSPAELDAHGHASLCMALSGRTDRCGQKATAPAAIPRTRRSLGVVVRVRLIMVFDIVLARTTRAPTRQLEAMFLREARNPNQRRLYGCNGSTTKPHGRLARSEISSKVFLEIRNGKPHAHANCAHQ